MTPVNVRRDDIFVILILHSTTGVISKTVFVNLEKK